MKKILASLKKLTAATLIASLSFLTFIPTTHAAWTYTQNFEGLTPGNINGQDSWSSTEGKLSVSTSNPYTGSQDVAITNDTTPYGATRAITSVTGSAHVYYAMRLDNKAAFDAGGAMAVRLIDSGTGARFHIVFNNADIGIGTSDTIAQTAVSGYTQAAYYLIDVDLDLDNNRARMRVSSDGLTWGTYTSYVTNASVNSIETFGVYGGTVSGSGTGYLDDISATDPIVVAGEAPAAVQPILKSWGGGFSAGGSLGW